MKVPWHLYPLGAGSRGSPYLAEATPCPPLDVVTSVLDAIAFPNFGSISSRAQLHTAKVPCLDLGSIITSLPRALSFPLDVSNTLGLALSSSRFGRLGMPFSSSPAALDQALDALHNSTTCPSNHARP
jgi:hypothetical protein